MGVGGRGGGARPPSHVAYYVALAGILGLLCMLLAYFACFCVKRVKVYFSYNAQWKQFHPKVQNMTRIDQKKKKKIYRANALGCTSETLRMTGRRGSSRSTRAPEDPEELVQQDCTSLTHVSARAPPPATTAYPVQPVVRDSASAMAKLCRQLPAPTPVYPAASSPEAARAQHAAPPPAPPAPRAPGKAPAPAAAVIPRIEVDMVDAR